MADKESKFEKKEENIDNNFIFSKKNVNTSHQSEFDYFKTIIAILIVIVHVYSYYNIGYFGCIVYPLIQVLGAPGCMIQMGIGMKYSRHHEIKYFITRGIILLSMGQYINLIRNGLPSLITWWITKDKVFLSRVLLFLQTDIYHFAGISFLFLSLLKKIKLTDKLILIIGIILNIFAYFLYKIMISPDNYLLSQFLGFFIFTTNTETMFSLCCYFIFVSFGYWLGGIYQKISNKDRFYNLILIFCLPTIVIYYYLRANYDFPILPKFLTAELYYLYPGPDAIASCLTNVVSFSIFYKINKMIKGKTPEFIRHTAKNFSQYYMISFVLTIQMNTFLKATRGENYTYEMKYPTLFALMILIICRILIDINNEYIHFTIVNLKNPKRNFVFALIWIITIIILIYTYPKVEVYTTQWNAYYYEK